VFEELLKVGGAGLLVPCVLAAVSVTLAKGLFGIHQSKRATRKDFLDLWARRDAHDELWQQTAIRHLFGEWLPVPVIRLLLKSSQSGQALAEISGAWDLLEIDDETHAVNWKGRRRRKPSFRRREIVFFTVLYWFFAMLMALFILYDLVPSHVDLGANMRWLLPIEMAVFFFACLVRRDDLKVAHKAVPRWLDIP
jgi:hypothetical protein